MNSSLWLSLTSFKKNVCLEEYPFFQYKKSAPKGRKGDRIVDVGPKKSANSIDPSETH